MNWDLILKFAGLALPVLGMIYTFFANRKKDVAENFREVNERLNAGSKRMDQHDLEIQALTQTVAAMPAKDDVHRMELAMSEISGEIKAIGAHIGAQRDVMRRLETVVTRHEDHLLEGGKGK